MEIRTIQEGNKTTIFLEGKFTFEDRVSFQKVALLDNIKNTTDIIIDCTNLKYMDSSSVGILLILHEHSQKRGIHVSAVNIGKDIKPLFEQSVLGKLFDAKYQE